MEDRIINIGRWVKNKQKRIIVDALVIIAIIAVIFTGLQVQVNSTGSYIKGYSLFNIGNHEVVITIGTVDAATVTDYQCNGIADSTVFQTAIDALPASGGKLEVLGGTYNFIATVTRAIDNITISGVGKATYFNYDGVNPIFTAGGNNWVFSNFSTDGGGVDEGATTGWIKQNIWEGATYLALNLSDAAHIYLGDETASLYFGTGNELSLGKATAVESGNTEAIRIKDDTGILMGSISDQSTNPLHFYYMGYFQRVYVNPSSLENVGFRVVNKVKKTDAALTSQVIGLSGEAWVDDENTQNWTHARAMVGLDGYVSTAGGNTGSVTGAIAVQGSGYFNGGTVAKYYSLYGSNPIVGVGSVTTAYGLYLEDINTGGTNYAIFSNGGLIYLAGEFTAPIIFSATGTLIKRSDTNQYIALRGSSDIAGGGCYVSLFGKTHANTGMFRIATPDAAGTADIVRFSLSGVTAIATASWTNTKQVFDANSLPDGDPHLAGQLYYDSSDNIVRRSGG